MFGVYIKALCRTAVPVFFMISGFFYDQNSSHGRIVRQIKKILGLFLVANVFYFFWNGFVAVCRGDELVALLKSYVTPMSIIKLVIFHESPVEIHLWYLCAAAFSYIILLLIRKWGLFPLLYRGWPVLLVINLLCGVYSTTILGCQIPPTIARSCYFTGVPFFMLGFWLHQKQDWIRQRFTVGGLGICTAIFAALVVLEKYLLIRFAGDPEGDLYFSTIFLAVSIFLLFVSARAPRRRLLRKLASVGQHDTVWIYIFHVAVINIVRLVPETTPIGMLLRLVFPVVILTVTLVLIALFKRLWRKIGYPHR